MGVYVSGSEATLEGAVVRGTQPQASDQQFGRGINIEPDPLTGAPSTALVTSSLVEQNHEIGVFVGASQGTLEGLVVRGTQPQASDQLRGRGIEILSNQAIGAPATAVVRSSLIEQNHDLGVFVGASQGTLEGLIVRGTLPQASDQLRGRGIQIQQDLATGTPATAIVRSSLVEQNHDAGVTVNASVATLEHLVVRGTLPRVSDGSLGDGVVVASAELPGGVDLLASAIVTTSRIEQNARAGLCNFGAHVALGGSVLSCNAFELNGEMVFGLPHTFENLGGNGCGCPEPTGACAAQSSGLTLPEL